MAEFAEFLLLISSFSLYQSISDIVIPTYLYFCRLLVYHQTIAVSWSSLVEWDEQLDWPNSQTWTEWCYTYASYFFIFHEHNSLPLGPIQPSSYSTYELHDLCNKWKEVRTLSTLSVSWTVHEDKSLLFWMCVHQFYNSFT